MLFPPPLSLERYSQLLWLPGSGASDLLGSISHHNCGPQDHAGGLVRPNARPAGRRAPYLHALWLLWRGEGFPAEAWVPWETRQQGVWTDFGDPPGKATSTIQPDEGWSVNTAEPHLVPFLCGWNKYCDLKYMYCLGWISCWLFSCVVMHSWIRLTAFYVERSCSQFRELTNGRPMCNIWLFKNDAFVVGLTLLPYLATRQSHFKATSILKAVKSFNISTLVLSNGSQIFPCGQKNTAPPK